MAIQVTYRRTRKAAIKRVKIGACSESSEREQARPKVKETRQICKMEEDEDE